MSKTPPPLLGFNNNVRHQGRIFHIQTEDSGVKNPRIVTHLFADGGRILKTTRTDYTEHLGREDMVPVLRRIMKEQHKGMFIALRAGELNQLIEDAVGPPPEPKPPEASAPEAAATEAAADGSEDDRKAVPPPIPKRRPRQRTLSNPNLQRVIPSVPPPKSSELDALDVTSMDRNPPRSSQLPEEPSPGGTPALGTPAVSRDPAQPAEAAASAEATDGAGADEGAGRYAQSKPADIFSDAPPERKSIFGDNVISEKSLDEVILSYLAEDLEEGNPQE